MQSPKKKKLKAEAKSENMHDNKSKNDISKQNDKNKE